MYTEALRTMGKDELIAHYLWKGLNLEMFKVLEILPQSGSDAAIIMKRKKGKHTPWCVEYKGSGRLLEKLDAKEFPNLTYTRDLQDWGEFVRRTPDEYEAWVNGVTKECTVLEIKIIRDLVSRTKKTIFVDTNIPVEILHKISDENHVLVMLADPNISVQRFFERPDKEKQFFIRCYWKKIILRML